MRFPRAVLLAPLVLLFATLQAPPVQANGCVGSNFPSGTGSVGDPFEIADASDLTYLGSDQRCWGYSFLQSADIAMSGTWTPIGRQISSTLTPFTGNFDGGSHSISGLEFANLASYVGLFGSTDGASLSNITVSSATAVGDIVIQYAGGLVGLATDTQISNVTATVDIHGVNYVGGLIGQLNGGSVANSTASGSLDGSGVFGYGSGLYIGGLVGGIGASAATITDSSFTSGSVSAEESVGGLIGGITGSSGDGNVTLTSTSSAAAVSAAATFYEASAGGLIGALARTTGRVTIDSASATGNVTSANGSFAGGLIGKATGLYTIQDSTASGDVTGSDEVGGFVGFIQNPDATSVIQRSSASGDVTGSSSTIGGFLGEATGTTGLTTSIANSSASGAVAGSAASSVGGFAGKITLGNISDSYSTGSVTGKNYVGGFIGLNIDPAAITNSYATGNTDGNDAVGGFIGSNQGNGTISDVYATGRVRGAYISPATGWSAGGLFGNMLNGGALERGFATGDVSGLLRVGGLVGELDGPSSGTPLTVTDSYATGSVAGKGGSANYIGGITGINRDLVEVTNSYTLGAITTESSGAGIGGITGIQVNALSTTGVYWNSETTGMAYASGVASGTGTSISGSTALTSAQMRSSSNFSGWNFSSVWGYQCSVSSTPALRWANSSATNTSASTCPTPSPSPSTPSSAESTSGTTTPVVVPDVSGTPAFTAQAPGLSQMIINGEQVPIVVRAGKRGQGLTIQTGPISGTLRSTTPAGVGVPLTKRGALVIARAGDLQTALQGLEPGSTLTQTLYSSPLLLADTQASLSGTTSVTPEVPGYVPLGDHTLVIAGTTQSGEKFTLSMGVLVETPAAALGANPLVKVSSRVIGQDTRTRVTLSRAQGGCAATFSVQGKRVRSTISRSGRAHALFTSPSSSRSPSQITVLIRGKGCSPVRVVHKVT